ncbi:unnamed protein product, partial [Closterium sp. NIES-54]
GLPGLRTVLLGPVVHPRGSFTLPLVGLPHMALPVVPLPTCLGGVPLPLIWGGPLPQVALPLALHTPGALPRSHSPQALVLPPPAWGEALLPLGWPLLLTWGEGDLPLVPQVCLPLLAWQGGLPLLGTQGVRLPQASRPRLDMVPLPLDMDQEDHLLLATDI